MFTLLSTVFERSRSEESHFATLEAAVWKLEAKLYSQATQRKHYVIVMLITNTNKKVGGRGVL